MNKQYFINKLTEKLPSNFDIYNYDLVPETFLAFDKIEITCLKHGIFYQKAGSHLFGAGCRDCSVEKNTANNTLTTTDFINNSIFRFGNKFNYLKTKYIKKDIELTITCPVHGDILITPDQHRWSKHGCPKCDYDIPRQISQQKYIEKAKIVHGNKYDYSKVTYINSEKKVEIICPIHGSFWQSLFYHTTKHNQCFKCSHDNDRLSQDDFIKRSKLLYGDRYDYSKVEYITNASMVIITCKKHGDFIQRAGSHLAGCECKKCKQEERLGTKEQFIKNAKIVHGDKYDYSKVEYIGIKRKVEIICPVHGSFWQRPNTHISNKAGCRFCSDSKGEKIVELILKKYNINYIREYKILPYLYRYDFYLPELNIFIEFNGQQHYKPIPIFGGDHEFQKTKERDIIKKQIIKNINGHLIIIPYTRLKEDVVEKELVRGLKRVYKFWFVVDNKLHVFKNVTEVVNKFNISLDTLVRNIVNEVRKVIDNFRVLF